MTHVLAHGFGGTNGLPLPRWLLAYLVGFAIALTFLVLRVVRTRPPVPTDPPSGGDGDRPVDLADRLFVVTRAVGLALFVGTLVAAAVGVDDSGANIATVTVIVLFFLGLQLVSALFGDVYWALHPFDTMAVAVFGRDPDGGELEAPWWTGGALLAAFVWFVFAYPEFYPPRPHEVAVFLALYTIAVLAGAARWGRAWVRHGEAFGGLFALLAGLSPIGWDGERRRLVLRAPVVGVEAPGLRTRANVALLVVYLGGIGFDGLSQTTWWIHVLGTSRGWEERAVNTAGLAWCIAVVAAVYALASWASGRLSGFAPATALVRYALVLAPVGLGWSLAHYLSATLIDVQNFYALASDPLGRGWDLFGTASYLVDYRPLTVNETGWVQTVLLIAGSLGGALVVHDIAFTTTRGRAAVRATYPLAAALVVASVGAFFLLLGT